MSSKPKLGPALPPGGMAALKKMNKANKNFVKNAVRRKKKITAAVMKRTGTNIRGRGAYSLSDLWNDVSTPFRHTESVSNLNKIVRSGASALGTELTGSSTLGRYAGNVASWFTKLMGSGTYTVKGNSVMAGPEPGIATFKPNGSTVVTHREFIKDITGSTGFTNSGYLLNPGNADLFPWLSTMALNYEQYEWLGLAFEFKSSCSFSTATGNLGTVIMATDYDALDANFASKREMEIADFSGSASPVNTFMHFIECAPKQSVLRQMYVQQGNVVEDYPDDPRFSIPGRFQLGTQGMPSEFVIGELWVTYHVKLMKPTIAPASASSTAWASYQGIILPSVTTLPLLLPNTGGSTNLGIVRPWTKSPAIYVTGLSFENFEPGNYLATIVSKRQGSDEGPTVDIGASEFANGGSPFDIGYNSSGILNAEPLASRGVANAEYVDTFVGTISFSAESTSSVARFPFRYWDVANNCMTVIVTKLVLPTVSAKKTEIKQLVEAAVARALQAHGKDEVSVASDQSGQLRNKLLQQLAALDTDDGEEVPPAIYYPTLRREETVLSSSSSSVAIGSRSGSKK
jgi:hypothetical protein